MKKILLSMLAVLSILFLITACGDKPGDNPVDPSAPEKPSEGVQSKTLKQELMKHKMVMLLIWEKKILKLKIQILIQLKNLLL